ncbi:GNAT family N-acetyltransferase [Streptomyces sp. SW4]|nr:GNAT family N-acetyltransferase [Streptomyces sp. SW4]
MLFRAMTPSDLDRVLPLLPSAQVGAWVDADAFRRGLADGAYRPEWTWIAEDGGGVRAVALWWGTPHDDRPSVLDTLHAHADGAAVPAAHQTPAHGTAQADGTADAGAADPRAVLAAELLTAAHRAFAAGGAGRPPEYHVMLPADWRERPDAVRALAWRREAARRAGLTVPLERLRYEWTRTASAPPAPSGRLRLRPEPDDEVFADLFRRVLEGTLDAGTRTAAEAVGAEAQARSDVAFYRDSMRGERSWWRVAETPAGEPVGFAVPSRNATAHVVGYLGVLPEHRGNGHVDDLLAETTRLLAEEAGAGLVRADTDLSNRPMAAAFERLGYRAFARRLVLSAP